MGNSAGKRKYYSFFFRLKNLDILSFEFKFVKILVQTCSSFENQRSIMFLVLSNIMHLKLSDVTELQGPIYL